MAPFSHLEQNRSRSLSDMRRPKPTKRVSPVIDEYVSFQGGGERLHTPYPSQVPFVEEKTRTHEQTTSRIPSSTGSSKKVFFLAIFILSVFLLGGVFFFVVLPLKDRIMIDSETGTSALLQAVTLLREKQYDQSAVLFREAVTSFEEAEKSLFWLGGPLLDMTRFVPGLSKASSGKHAVLAGKHFGEAGESLSVLIKQAVLSKEAYAQGEKVSLLSFFVQAKDPLTQARESLSRAERELALVRIDDLPAEKKEKFLLVRTSLPSVLALLSGFEKNEILIEELLGGNGPRTYLFLLQNNHEMRATGGFIGTYALIDINEGIIRRFFVDGIFNPDGQLKENIIPPKPIQKISAGWSLHDSNWFPDFPASAEKAISFYEKTGGPTVDGVITLTPTIMQKLLVVVGPIAMPQYGITVDADNFIPVLQEQVEVKYDKELNQPKKILADLTQMLIEKVFALQNREMLGRIAGALVDGLNEKHMLLYMRHAETQVLIDEVGWSGRVLDTPKDYLSVIHSNINGYKTDGVIQERIEHKASIEEDGSIVDTVKITRTHTGGDTPYEWWNKVNADYVRIYVPKGSELLSSQGTTWEFPAPPLDYERLGFKEDADVKREESTLVVDEKTGIRVSEDAGKTVFGAWVYVSPKESVTTTFQYRLPFRIDRALLKKGEAQSYSMLFQKQSGSPGSELTASLVYPENFEIIWQTEPNLVPYGREWRRETDLKTDVFQGVVFQEQ